LLIGNPYERQQRPLIDFSLIKPKGAPVVSGVVQQ
jgi:heptose-I-phosphate ethanolaminephosphotransferase